MNARQKAKLYKKKYEELLNTPVPINIITYQNIDRLKIKRMDRVPEESQLYYREEFINIIASELRKYIKENNITIKHSKQAGLDIFESELYLGFDKEGLVDDIYK